MPLTSMNYKFSTNDRNFVFDGNNVDILEIIDQNQADIKVQQKIPKKINSHKGSFLRTLVLNLTNNCNLYCDYCFAKQGKYDKANEIMSFDTAKKSIDILIDSVINNKGNILSIAFFGGEPLLEFNLIKEIVEYVTNNTPANVITRYLITTNGMLLDQEKVDFIRNNNFLVTVSIDGDKSQHDAYRKDFSGRGSYDKVAKIISNYQTGLKLLTGRITITDKNVNIYEAVQHIRSLGIQNITYALDYAISDEVFNQFIISLEDLMDNYLVSIKNKDYYNITNITSVVVSLAFNLRTIAHCNAGVSYLSVSADGKFYRCPRFTGHQDFCLGSLETLDYKQIETSIANFREELKDNTGNRTLHCNNCNFIYLCGGICYHHAFTVSKSQFGQVPRECFYRKKLYDLVFKFVCKLTESDRNDFLLYLKSIGWI